QAWPRMSLNIGKSFQGSRRKSPGSSSFAAKGFDGVQLGGFVCRVESRSYATEHQGAERKCGRPGNQARRIETGHLVRQGLLEEPHQSRRNANADESADACQQEP